jgi:hypothetical protein
MNDRRPPPARPAPDPAGVNERFVRTILALVTANAEHRTEHKSYGEVVVKFTYANGAITMAKMVEENVFKPGG